MGKGLSQNGSATGRDPSACPTKNLQQYATLAVASSDAAADRHPAPHGLLSGTRFESTTSFSVLQPRHETMAPRTVSAPTEDTTVHAPAYHQSP
jgi:hypothetical protein